MITGRKPGRALDVAMGQGRNALWLVTQGRAVALRGVPSLGSNLMTAVDSLQRPLCFTIASV
jgi:hypothetical protein